MASNRDSQSSMEAEDPPPQAEGDNLSNVTSEPSLPSGGNHSGSASLDYNASQMDDNASRGGGEGEEGEDLLDEDGGNMVGGLRDYRDMEHLDRYESEGLDSQFEESADPGERMRARVAADEAMARRDQLRQRRRMRLPAALDDDVDPEGFRPRRRQRREEAMGGAPMSEGEEDDIPIRLEDVRGSLAEAVHQEPVQRELRRRFKAFLLNFKPPAQGEGAQAEGAQGSEGGDAVPHYVTKIADMCKANRQSLEVSYTHLSVASPALALWLSDIPSSVLETFHDVARECTLSLFPDYGAVRDLIFVRVVDFPLIDPIRDIRQGHLHQLVRTSGVVTRRTGVFPQLQEVMFSCDKCNYTMGPFLQQSGSVEEIKPAVCSNCQSKGPFSLNVEGTVYRNYQKVTLQESPGKVPAGRLPRTKELILLHDLIDCARPGEEIDVTGVYEYSFDAGLHAKQGFPVFATKLEVNSVTKKADQFAEFHLTDEDKQAILRLSRDPRVGRRIVKSIAPSIYGHRHVKTGLALAMFGAQEKHAGGGAGRHRVRGDINVLMLGDPGMAKSQFLKYVEQTSSRSVYTTGKGASAVGLTAAVHRDPVTREWTLEGGALVLADRGVCLIDEFDKMNDQDRVSIHEAMEQQSISISKAGIVTSLQARCSVIAAANPTGGRYDASRSFAENVELTDPILSRFDVLCVVKDVVDEHKDAKLANFVIRSHMKNHPDAQQEGEALQQELDQLLPSFEADEDEDADLEPIDQELLRKYISYAKAHSRPRLESNDLDKLARVYAELRRESLSTPGGVPIAVRHLESLIRMSEASAAMHLRASVVEEDIDLAIRVLLEGFVTSQRQSAQKQLRRRLRRFVSRGTEDYRNLLAHLLRSLVRDQVRLEAARAVAGGAEAAERGIRVDVRYFEGKAREYGITDLQAFYRDPAFTRRFQLDEQDGTILAQDV